MCDKQGLFRDGRDATECACVNMEQRVPKPCFVLNLKIQILGGETIVIQNFSIQSWLEMFVFLNGIPPGYRIDDNDWLLMESIGDAIDEVLSHVNANGGWDALAWAKFGYITDRATTKPDQNQRNPYGESEGENTKSGTLTHHLVTLLPSRPMNINPVTMDDFMINLAG